MIELDRQQRRIAQQIADSGNTWIGPDQTHDKVVLYGLFGALLKNIDRSRLRPIGNVNNSELVSETIRPLGHTLLDACLDVAHSKGAQSKELDDRVERVNRSRHFSNGITATASSRLFSGVRTALEAEVITLQTIQSRLEGGQQITHSGLHNSFLIPFKLAMLHVNELGPNRAMFQDVHLSNGHVAEVFTEETATMTPQGGLRFRGEPLAAILPIGAVVAEPRIGCPATLAEHFIRDFHVLAADMVVQRGIIQITE